MGSREDNRSLASIMNVEETDNGLWYANTDSYIKWGSVSRETRRAEDVPAGASAGGVVGWVGIGRAEWEKEWEMGRGTWE